MGVVAAAGVEVAVEVAAGVEAVTAVAITGAVGLLEDFTVEAVAGMAEAVATMVPWPTWVMGGVAVHRARTAGLTGIRHLLVTP